MLFKYIVDKRKDTDSLKNTMERVANLLINNETTVEHPGILLGLIQSGKTRAFIGIMAKCFDEGYDVTVVLTKSSRALAAQTVKRIKSEFSDPVNHDYLAVYDIMELPYQLTPFILNKKLVFIVKKEDDNLRRLRELFFTNHPILAEKRVLIIDDEADYASVTYATDRGEPDGIRYGVLATNISDFRSNIVGKSDYLQITGTPYSLYLQPDEIIVNDGVYAPLRPRFTEILEPYKTYIGGRYYFEKSLNQNSPASDMYIQVPSLEFDRLRRPHGSYLNTVHSSSNLEIFRTGIINFLVAGSIRILQERNIGESEFPWKRVYKCSYLIHTEQRTASHGWQCTLVNTLIERLGELIQFDQNNYNELIKNSYDNLAISLNKTEFDIPSLEETTEKVTEAIIDGEISVTEVNSINSVINQLDDSGQLTLDNPFNIFIGGQVLDRGITIENLIGFFYGRNPQSFQMDTVLQHSRMYGARSPKDLAVTRIYTSARIYRAMTSMHFFDSALRNSIMKLGDDATVRFIERDPFGGIRPCGPSKIRISNLQALRQYSRFLPVGFQTKAPSSLSTEIEKIDTIIQSFPTDSENNPIATVDQVIEIIDIVSNTYEYSTRFNNIGWEWDVDGFKEILRYCTTFSNQDKVILLLRDNRNISRMKNNNLSYTDAPDDGRNDLEPARQLAISNPVIMLIKQNGNENRGWRNHPFYWPVLISPRNTRPSIYTAN